MSGLGDYWQAQVSGVGAALADSLDLKLPARLIGCRGSLVAPGISSGAADPHATLAPASGAEGGATRGVDAGHARCPRPT
jgi:hypothetical protein